jgi:hypothetical protein
MIYKGGCHCGRTAFEVEGNLEQVMDCNCSICSQRGYLHWYVQKRQAQASLLSQLWIRPVCHRTRRYLD